MAILGVGERGSERGIRKMCKGRDLPWLQDTDEADWWGEWDIVYRDVVILDDSGERAAVFNLTANDLTTEEAFNELEALLLQVATPQN